MAKRNPRDKTIKIERNTTLDKDGVVTRRSTMEKVIVSQEPPYIKLYLNTLLAFKNLPKQMSTVLWELIKLTTFADPESEHGGQLILLNAFVKKDIVKRMGIKINTLDQYLTKLTKSEIIRRVGIGTYQANPHMFGMGDWTAIKAIRATFDFNAGTVKADIKTDSYEGSFLERAAAGKIDIDSDEDEED
jgi:hypothetical protein